MKSGQILGINYTGRRIPMSKASAPVDHPYAVENLIGKNYIIADTSDGGILRYANDNSSICHGHFYLRTERAVVAGLTMDVKAGDEIFLSYGDAYWEGHEKI
jgi:hypothetical protein